MAKGKGKKADTAMTKIAAIRRDGGTQAREGIKQAAVNEYTAALRDGEVFPPVVVFNDGESLWLADGFHRVAAALNLGLEEISAETKEGTVHEAKWYAMGANKGHGERMSNADKRHAVTMALEDDELSQRSNREIAEQCKVSEHLVRTLRDEQGATKSQFDQNSLKEKASDSKDSEIKRLEKELADREEFEKKQEAELEAVIAERVQKELAKQPAQSPDEEVERLRRELAEREEAEQEQVERAQRMEYEMETLKNGDHPDIKAIIEERLQEALAAIGRPDRGEEIKDLETVIAERVQEELAKRPVQVPDEEVERLRRELAEREEAEQEHEERAQRMEYEMETLKNGDHPDIKAIIEDRLQEALTSINRPDQSEEMWEEALRRKEEEQAELQNQIEAKTREINEAKSAGMEISELSGQKDNLISEIANLKNDLTTAYLENARTRFKEAGSGIDSVWRVTEFLNERLREPDFCKLIAQDMLGFREDMESMKSAADTALEVSDQVLFQLGGETGAAASV